MVSKYTIMVPKNLYRTTYCVFVLSPLQVVCHLSDFIHYIFFNRQLESHYPHFPVYASALYSVLSLPDMQTQSQDKLVVLSKFICKMPELQTTLPLLPDFMEFYQWLHKDLAGVLTPEKADKISIKRLVDQMSSHYSSEICRKLIRLYQRVKCNKLCMVDAELLAVMIFFLYSNRLLQPIHKEWFNSC